MIQIPKIDIHPYWEIVKRRKWWLIIPFVLVLMLGSGYIVTSPKVYRASTLILVEAQRVPSRYVKSTISQGLTSRLNTITQQIKSRSYLQKVINRFDLTKKESSSKNNNAIKQIKKVLQDIPFMTHAVSSSTKKDDESVYSMVKLLRDKIDVRLHGRRNNAFEVNFEWHDPEVASNVTNALASQFIEQNLNLRSEMAMGTTDFLELQVQQLRSDLKEKERKLESFRNKHIGKLPSQLDSNLNILEQLKNEKNSLEKRIDMQKQQLAMLRKESNMGSLFNKSNVEKDIDEESSNLKSLKNKLEFMKSRYTSNHPDVIALKNRIKKLEKAENDSKKQTSTNSKKSSKTSTRNRIEQTRTKIENYQNQIEEIQKEIQKYQDRVEQTPKIEIKLKDLQRNYQTVQKRYENLLAKQLDAEMAEELEKRQKGEQFKVIDSAIPPKSPVKPDVGKLGLLTLFLGLGMGGGLAYLRETLDPAFYTAEDAENQLGRKVIVSLPWEDSKG